MKPHSTCAVLLTVVICFLAAGLAGCGGTKTSAKADARELEQAFGLKSGGAPSAEATPAGLASRAVAALRAQDWPKAESLLGELRQDPNLTVDQMRAVHNAQGNASVRLSEQAAKGNAEAKAALDRAKQEADRR